MSIQTPTQTPVQAPDPRLDEDEVAVTAPDLVAARWREALAKLGVTVGVRQNRGGDGLLRRLAPTLAATRGEVVVEGHSDSTPIGNRRFPSNWELSGGRAASVIRRLIELGVPPNRLSAVGFADTRPLSTGSDPASPARNRRVAITIQADGIPGAHDPVRAIP